jgi:glutaredoxin 3
MVRIEMYTTPTCPYCHAAKALLAAKNAAYEEISVAGDPALRQAMTQRAHGRFTVPQIFIGDVHVGGFEEMAALERRGELDRMLAGAD